ncbi:MAG: hypothetical protein RR576_00855, partial [Oscillospiraceae bacterium]
IPHRLQNAITLQKPNGQSRAPPVGKLCISRRDYAYRFLAAKAKDESTANYLYYKIKFYGAIICT